MTFWDFASSHSDAVVVLGIVLAGLLAAISLMVMDHHERMARIKYTQGHNK